MCELCDTQGQKLTRTVPVRPSSRSSSFLPSFRSENISLMGVFPVWLEKTGLVYTFVPRMRAADCSCIPETIIQMLSQAINKLRVYLRVKILTISQLKGNLHVRGESAKTQCTITIVAGDIRQFETIKSTERRRLRVKLEAFKSFRD